MQNLERIHREVCEEFGKILPLRVEENADTAYFDWSQVTLAGKFLDEDDSFIKNVLRHEFGHLFFSPRKQEVSIAMAYIAKAVGYENPWLFVNVLADIIVDMTNLEIFGEEYLRFLEHSMRDVPDGNGFVDAMRGAYYRKAKALGLDTNLNEHYLGSTIYDIIYDGNMDFYAKVLKIAVLMRSYIKVNEIPAHFIVHMFGKCDTPHRVGRALVDAGVTPDIIDAIQNIHATNGGITGDFLVGKDYEIIQYLQLKIIAKYLEIEEKLGQLNKKERVIGAWNLGDEYQSLDVVRTLSTFGTILPGVYSLKAVKETIGSLGNSRYKDAVIVLDCSGSMEGEKFMRAREAVYIIAKKICEAGGKVGLIPFSGVVPEKYVIRPTKVVNRVLNLVLSIIPHGGTVMGPALERAIELGRNKYVYVISDAGVADLEFSSQLLQKLSHRATFFLISSEHGVSPWYYISGVKVIEVDPDGLVRRVYQEVRN